MTSFLVALLLSSPAEAHRPGISYAQFGGHALRLTFARPELAGVAPLDDIQAARVLIAEATLSKAVISQGGQACEIGEPRVEEVEADGIEIAASIQCGGQGPWTYVAGYLPQLDPGHRVYLESEGQAVAVLDATAATASFEPGKGGSVALRFLGLGVEHIWTGYDHLAFLAGLVLVATSLRQMLAIVTGFTVAHSITLTLAAMEVFTIPAGIVEPAIAASILFVGLENFWRPSAGRRILTTFLLGLIHGFGFAGLLIALGLPTEGLLVAMLSFNGGVELGQAAIVTLSLPLLLWLRRYPWWDRLAVPILSGAVAAAGAYWLVSRVFLGG